MPTVAKLAGFVGVPDWNINYRLPGEALASAPGSECAVVRFEHAEPIRRTRARRGQRNFSGDWWMETGQRHVPFESWVERDFLILADFAPEFVAVGAQPFCWPRHLPALLEANSRHEKLANQINGPQVREAFVLAYEMVSHWDRIGQLEACRSRLADLLAQYPARAVVQPPQLDPRAPAARHPETVAMTELLLDHDWVGAVCHKAPWARSIGVDMIVQKITGRYRPSSQGDPLVHWVAGKRSFRGRGFTLPERERRSRPVDLDLEMIFKDRPGLQRFYKSKRVRRKRR